jgi:hypothetical protein
VSEHRLQFKIFIGKKPSLYKPSLVKKENLAYTCRMTPIKQIRNLLMVLFGGVAFGVLIFLYFLYYYGPNGQYIAKNVILAPEVIQTMSFKDSNLRTGGNTRFVFQDIEFSYKDLKLNQWHRIKVPLESYAKFYALVSNDRSISPEGIEDLFRQSARLILTIKTESNAEWQNSSKTFQEIHFSDEGNHFRVELHQENPSEPWVYFYHPGIVEKFLNIVIP